MKYKVIYFTEFGSKETTINEFELVDFIYRFKVSSIKALTPPNVSNINAKKYAEFCVMCDRKGLSLIDYDDYIKEAKVADR